MVERPTCGTCHHWLREFDDFGTCKRYPPTPMQETRENPTCQKLPQMTSADWCGEHKPRG